MYPRAKRFSAGQIYASVTKFQAVNGQRVNGAIRNMTPKSSFRPSKSNKQLRICESQKVGQIVTRSRTPGKNADQQNNTAKKKKTQSIEVQTQQALACLTEEPNKALINSLKQELHQNFTKKQYSQNKPGQKSLFTTNFLQTSKINSWNEAKFLKIADNNDFNIGRATNFKNHSNNNKLYHAQYKQNIAVSNFDTTYKNKIPDEKKMLQKTLHKNQPRCIEQLLQCTAQPQPFKQNVQSQKKVLDHLPNYHKKEQKPNNNGKSREKKINQMSETYLKNLAKYEQNKLLIKDLLKQENYNTNVLNDS